MKSLKALWRSTAEGRAMWTTVSKILISQEHMSTCEASGNGSSGYKIVDSRSSAWEQACHNTHDALKLA